MTPELPKIRIEEIGNDLEQIVLTDIPESMNQERLAKQIAELVDDRTIPDICAVRNEGKQMVLELRYDSNPKIVLNNLFKHTMLRAPFQKWAKANSGLNTN